ncbi:MAG TPA: TraB/GumN family protein [Chitinophagaceae bacterium]|nr:TraB/GumN family protein [Chitinophagaceae bacterium]
MKGLILSFILSAATACGFAQTKSTSNTLLWKITGKGLAKPSYLFGTIHMLCADDIQVSDSLKAAIKTSDKVYLELDMDNIFEMVGIMGKMKMRNDTTLADLLTPAQYDSVKQYFKAQKTLLPFSVLETYKPMLAASTLMQASLDCDNQVAMEQLIMKEAKAQGKGIKGLETMAYQMSIFDSIPYSVQAKQLYDFVAQSGSDTSDNKEFEAMSKAYRDQNLDSLEAITKKDDMGISNFTDLLLYNRNTAWAKKLETLMKDGSLVIAVGAGHLPGERGVINLLRKAGYTVQPLKNNMAKKPAEQQL